MVKIFIYFLFLIKIICSEENRSLNINLEEYNITQLKSFECLNSTKDCSNSGICNNEKDECICFEGYKTFFENPEDYFTARSRCNYLQKKQLFAFAFALLVSFGTAHFYLGNKIFGYAQLFLFLFAFIFNITIIVFISIKHLKKIPPNRYKESISLILIICFICFICLFWYLFDIFMILFNIYKDGDNVELHPFGT